MINPRAILSSLVAAVLVAIACWCFSSDETPQVSNTWEEPRVSPSTPALTLEPRAKSPPGSRVAMRLPDLDTGIPIGDGSFLPPLNGVNVEDGIPPIHRDRRLPPPGPVVAKQVDRTGQEWWVHADGSLTSCCYASVTLASGEDKIIVSTQHGALVPGSHGELPGR